ncbi:HEPN domain-containing protein [Rufibacter immobilis]|uniref:HEPN domain-containing protein n=1 Tax=Rufibacter immobilis TaxID=1348778 RepID=A0A3M9N1Z6_9BACT|nr:HEPN domain-containing protein [Rufibacter immobilis]RNI31819.1 HEPN domain-containing protein [Rufibacter immobilis]
MEEEANLLESIQINLTYLSRQEREKPDLVIAKLFEASSLPLLRKDLWNYLKAATSAQAWTLMDQPWDATFLQEQLGKLIEAFWLMLQRKEELDGEVHPTKFTYESIERFNDERIMRIEYDHLLATYSGHIRLLRQRELDNPYHVIKGFFQVQSLKGWKSMLADWTEYALRRASMLEETENNDLLIHYEQLERLLEVAYFLHGLHSKSCKSEADAKLAVKGKSYMANESDKRSSICSIIRFIAEVVQPEKIFLLNSLDFRNEGCPEFIELMVIIQTSNQKSFANFEPLVEFALLCSKDVSCSLHKADNVQRALLDGHIFYSLNCKPENLVYDDGSPDFVPTPKELYPKIIEESSKDFQSNYSRAVDFYIGATHYFKIGNKSLVPFMLHQAVELTYRAILQSLTGKEIRTHSLKAQIRHTRRCTPSLTNIFPRNTDKEKRLVHLLDEAYLHARYENNFHIEDAIIDILLNRVHRLQELARQEFEAKMQVFEGLSG